jgi:multidrug resistance protein
MGLRPKGGRGGAPLPPGFAAIWSCVALDLVGFGIVLPLLPIYSERFGATATTIGLLVAAYSLAQAVASPLLGRLADRIGRKPVLLISLAGTAVGSLLTGLAAGLVLLFVGRIVDGLSGGSVSVAQAAVADVASPDERPRLLGLLGAAFGVGFVVGPALGGLGALVSPRLPFFIAAAVAGVNAVSAVRRLPETHHRGRDISRHRSSSSSSPSPPGSSSPPGDEAAGVDVGGGGAGSVWRDRRVVSLVGVAFVALVAFSMFEATFALFGQEELRLRLASTAGVFTFVGVLIVIVQVRLVKPVTERFGEAGAVRVGLLTNALGLVLLAGVALVHSWAVAVPALVVLTVGQGLVVPTLASALAGHVEPARRGEVRGAQQSAGALARVVGPVAGGLTFGHLAFSAPLLIGGVLMTAAAATLSARGQSPSRPSRPSRVPGTTLPADSGGGRPIVQ